MRFGSMPWRACLPFHRAGLLCVIRPDIERSFSVEDFEGLGRIVALMDETLRRPTFYYQLIVVAAAVVAAWVAANVLRRNLGEYDETTPTTIRDRIRVIQDLLFPGICAGILGIAVAVSGELFHRTWLVQLVQGGNFLALTYLFATRITQSIAVKYFMMVVLVPIFCLYAIGVLDHLIVLLTKVEFSIGEIEFSLYTVGRTVVFGAILFWLGRISNAAGQDLIKHRATLDDTTRELALKSFQIMLVVVISIAFLQIAGIDLTALVVFGGAIGVGLGFGLQQIASNFISGIIILLDRSIAIGDHIELEDGRSGVLRELSMRSATLETFDGKDIMVPNERFITTAFTNWTHNNKKQRYPIHLSVAYDTDLEKLFEIIRTTVAMHPRVLSGEKYPIEERPDAEIAGFGDSGIDILVEFWMEGIDDGKNRVGADLLMMIWMALKENDIVIPFPQHEVKILNPKD